MKVGVVETHLVVFRLGKPHPSSETEVSKLWQRPPIDYSRRGRTPSPHMDGGTRRSRKNLEIILRFFHFCLWHCYISSFSPPLPGHVLATMVSAGTRSSNPNLKACSAIRSGRLPVRRLAKRRGTLRTSGANTSQYPAIAASGKAFPVSVACGAPRRYQRESVRAHWSPSETWINGDVTICVFPSAGWPSTFPASDNCAPRKTGVHSSSLGASISVPSGSGPAITARNAVR